VRIPFERKQSGRIRVEDRVRVNVEGEADAIRLYTLSAL